MTEWKKFKQGIEGLPFDLERFKVDFLDRDTFKLFCDDLQSVTPCREVCVTGYFSETIREQLEKLIIGGRHVRLICPEFPVEAKRDKRNIEALKKLAKTGAEIKFNNRMHARIFAAYMTKTEGVLVLGTFDFNTECIGKERYDAGIKTRHPDLLSSTIDLFEQLWNDSESIALEQFLGKS